jgi:predicted transcriptional regulator/DNA-binding XRE family transcriptional regulator
MQEMAMAGEGLTGSRIRERRTIAGLRQADLARTLGISASYLNLIEHNRRRIGGKLLLNIARELGVEPSVLTEGAQAALISTLREAATEANMTQSELERADELAGRFPGWAEVLATSYRRVVMLERTVEALTDRLAHDPQLAASVHELLSTAAAIRSTAGILAEEKEIEPVWRERFHNNLDADSRRLADSAKSLVEYFDAAQRKEDAAASPQDEVDSFMAEHKYTFSDLEAGKQSVSDLVSAASGLRSKAAKELATAFLNQIRIDAERVPLSELEARLGGHSPDPVALARAFDVSVGLILRRLASIESLHAGLVVCDRAGSLLFRKSTAHLVIPRFGAACALWPLFSALGQPGQVLHLPVVQLGRERAGFSCYAVAEVTGAPVYNQPPLLRASMLLIPATEKETEGALEVGSSCRVCPRPKCPGRREPSILADGL